MADISALFQAMGVGQQPQDPTAALQQSGLGPQAAPPQQDPAMDPLAAAEADLQKKYDQALAVWQADPKSMIPQNLADFKKYEDQQYQEKYGRQGAATRFMQQVLAGAKGKTLQEVNSESARSDWDEALKQQAQQIAQQKSQAGQAAQLIGQQLGEIRSQRAAQQARDRDITNNRRITENSPENKAVVAAQAKKDFIQNLKDSGHWDGYTDDERKFIEVNGKLPPPTPPKAIPGSAKGEDILQFHPDAKSGGTPLDKGKYYRLVETGNRREYEPTAPPGYEVPQTTTSERPVTVGNTVQSIPFSSTRGPTGATAPQGAGGGGPRILGSSPTEQRRAEEPTYTPKGQEVLQETQPVLDMMGRVKELLAPVKDQNMPFSTLVDRGAYSIGMATDASKLINKLELERIVGAARILKGSSRAISVLEDAKVHLPNPKIDSAKLMYEKTETILQALDDIKRSVDTYERKYPGRTDVKTDDLKKSGPKTADDFLKLYPPKR